MQPGLANHPRHYFCGHINPYRDPWRTMEAIEYATLEWVDWFNHRRLLEPIGNVPPAELEMQYFRQRSEQAVLA